MSVHGRFEPVRRGSNFAPFLSISGLTRSPCQRAAEGRRNLEAHTHDDFTEENPCLLDGWSRQLLQRDVTLADDFSITSSLALEMRTEIIRCTASCNQCIPVE